MKVLVIYRPNSDHSRIVDDFVRDYGRSHDASQLELLDIDSREGDNAARLYDVVQYPAVLVMQADGQVQKVWQGQPLPLMGEVAAYARA